jgi:hypothetical protein
VGALIAALIQINVERNHRRADEGKDRAERRVSQARLIAAFLGSEETRGRPGIKEGGQPNALTPIYLLNSSTEPVYQLVIAIVAIQGVAPQSMEGWLDRRKMEIAAGRERQPVPITTASVLVPGKFRVLIPGSGWWSQHLSGRSSVEVAFTDSAGVHWVRRSDGRLEELLEAPLKYFGNRGLNEPFELQTPEATS